MTGEYNGNARRRTLPAGWPALCGPANAVDWALAIRRETIERFDDYIRREAPKLDEANRADLAGMRSLVRAWMLSETDAGFWIANRGASVHEWFLLAARSDARTRAYAQERSSSPRG